MRLRLTPRNRIFIGILLIYTIGVCALLYNLIQNIDPRYRESAEDSLVETANLLASVTEQYVQRGAIDVSPLRDLMQMLHAREFSANIYGVQKNRVELRVHVVDEQGIVLYDSLGQNTGADYSGWRDTALTLRGQYGARTTSDIPNDKSSAVMYVSAPIRWNGEIIGAITVGKPVQSYGQYIDNARKQILYVGIFSAIAIALLALIVAIWLTQPLGLVTEYIRYVRAQKSINLPRLGRRALDLFAQGYENMRDALAGRHYVTKYVQVLTHELKSPLSAIRGATELLQEPMPEAQRQRFLQNIERETRRVQELVDRMQELTALEQRRSIKDPQIIALAPLLDELVSGAQAIAAARHIDVKLQLPDHSATLAVEGDRFLLHRAIRNLLDNAIDFSPDNGEVLVSLHSHKRTVSIHIKDQGPGIPDYAQDRVFEKFYSLARPGSHKKSTGLGLSFVKEITILHYGTVALHNVAQENHTASSPNEKTTGTIASLTLPLADVKLQNT